MVSEKDIDSLLAPTATLFKNIYTFSCTRHHMPGKAHHGAAIAYQDIVERREPFLDELRNTMCSWVYSKQKYRAILDEELKSRENDSQSAASHIQTLVRKKFRTGFPQGQFGELLLFNFLQHYFKAPPILRKMPLTTNPSIERHGADAIHFRPSSSENKVFIGEAKSYKSKYGFAAALTSSVDSILKTLEGLYSELSLYVYDDFIEEPLREVAKKVRSNQLSNVVYELVCVISFAESVKLTGSNQRQIENNIETIVINHLKTHKDKLTNVEKNKVEKIHFILLPFWNFDQLLDEFDT